MEFSVDMSKLKEVLPRFGNLHYIGNPKYLDYNKKIVQIPSSFYSEIKTSYIMLDYGFAKYCLENFVVRVVFLKEDNTIRVMYATHLKPVYDSVYSKYGKNKSLKYDPRNYKLLPCIDLQILKYSDESPFRMINLKTLLYWEIYIGEIPPLEE